jgi:hypothetical protein
MPVWLTRITSTVSIWEARKWQPPIERRPRIAFGDCGNPAVKLSGGVLNETTVGRLRHCASRSRITRCRAIVKWGKVLVTNKRFAFVLRRLNDLSACGESSWRTSRNVIKPASCAGSSFVSPFLLWGAGHPL